MYPRTWLFRGVGLVLMATLMTTGCAKRIPVDDGAFEAQENVVLLFSNDRSLHGKIDTDSNVRYVDAGSSYRAQISSVSETTIILEGVVLEKSAGSVEEAALRLGDSRMAVDDEIPEIVLLRSEVEGVERVGFDGPTTLRNVTFWGLSGVILGFLLGERS